MKIKIIYTMTLTILFANTTVKANLPERTPPEENPQTTYDPDLHLLIDPESIVKSDGITIIVNHATKHPEPIIVSSYKPYRMGQRHS